MPDSIIISQRDLPQNKTGWVVHILVPEPLGEVGGADLHVLELAMAQKQRSIFQPLVLMTQNQEYADRLEKAEIPYIPGHTYKNRFAMIRMLGRLSGLEDIRLIHSHGYDANYLTYLLRLIFPYRWGRIPTVMTCHGWVEDSFFHRMKTWLDFFTYRTAKTLIIDSPHDRKRLTRFSRRCHIAYVPNGIFLPMKYAVSNNKRNMLDQYHISDGIRIVAAVGRLSPEKRLDIYLAACKQIAAVIDDVHFLVVGSGSERDHLESLAKSYGIQDRVTFTGFVSEINSVYQTLSLLILSSDTEGTPRVVLEAMAHSLPVVATQVGGLDQMIHHGEHGYLVNRGDATALAKYAIDLLRNENKRIDMGKQAYIRVHENFSIWQMQEGVEEAYKRTLNL